MPAVNNDDTPCSFGSSAQRPEVTPFLSAKVVASFVKKSRTVNSGMWNRQMMMCLFSVSAPEGMGWQWVKQRERRDQKSTSPSVHVTVFG
jgi:hypothetical protein